MPVLPLLYYQARMLAEAALGVPNGETSIFWFSPENTNGPVLEPPGGTLPTDGVLVSATNFTTVAPLAEVRLSAGAQDPGINVLDLQPGVQADAAFWTEGSVQKFVLPYYASCMGYSASAAVTRLQSVWNGTMPDGRQVYALLHVTGSGGPPNSVEPIWVVYLDPAGASRAVPLANFTAQLPTLPTQPLPQSVDYVQPLASVLQGPSPTYGALRSLAESSAAFDESPTYFVYDPARNIFTPTDDPPTDGSAIVVPVFNPTVPASRPPVTVTLTVPGGATGSIFDWMSYEKDDPANYPDSFFWTTGAIEQFMLPYYASIDGFAGLPDLLSIQNAWLMNINAMGGYFTGGAPGTFAGPETGEQLLGLVHIPRSVWVTEEEGAALGESGFVHLGPDGKTRVTRAREFIAKWRSGR